MVHAQADTSHTLRCSIKSFLMCCAASLLPGSLVNARVRHILGDGLQLSFLTYFSGTVDIFHLAQVTGT